MKYLAFAMKLTLILSGVYLFFTAKTHPSPQCVTGLSVFIIGLYFALQGKFGESFTGCIFNTQKTPKKKGFFG